MGNDPSSDSILDARDVLALKDKDTIDQLKKALSRHSLDDNGPC